MYGALAKTLAMLAELVAAGGCAMHEYCMRCNTVVPGGLLDSALYGLAHSVMIT